jgi:hypothetical protein
VSIGEGFRDRLLLDATVVGLVGARVAPYIEDDGTEFPRISYRIENDERVVDLAQTDATRVATVEVECFSRTEDEAISLSDAVESALRGVTPAGYSGVIVVQDVTGDAAPPFDGSREPVYRRVVRNLTFYWS